MSRDRGMAMDPPSEEERRPVEKPLLDQGWGGVIATIVLILVLLAFIQFLRYL